MYEALVDLDNLLHDANYIEHMEAANLKQMLDLVSAADNKNPLMDGLTTDDTVIARLRDRFHALKCAGKTPLLIEQRCRRINRLDEYRSTYKLLCLDTHNNIAALAERHMNDPESVVPQISFFAVADPLVTARRLENGMWFLLQAARMVHGAFRVSPELLESLVETYQRERMDRLQTFT